MSRMSQIIASLSASKKVINTPDDLLPESKVTLAYHCLRSALNSASYWNTQAESADSPENMAFCQDREAEARAAIPGLMGYLNQMSHYVEASLVIGDFDHASIDGTTFEVDVESDEVVAERYSAKTHPYAWAKRLLDQSGLWDYELVPEEPKPIMWFNLGQVADRIAGRTAGELCLALIDDKDTGSKRILRHLEISGLSPTIIAYANRFGFAQRLMALSKKHPPYVNNAGVSPAEMAKAWATLVEMDEDDEFAESLRAEAKEINSATRTHVAASLRLATLSRALEDGVTRLKAAGVCEGIVDAFTASIAKKMAEVE